MAKKKKQTRSRAKKVELETESSPFWHIVGGAVFFVIAIFILFGGFGTGGPLPKAVFKGGYWLFGIAAYLLPVAFLFFGIHKFKNDNHKIPFRKLISMLGVLIFVSGLLFTAFAVNTDGTYSGGHGGKAGEVLGGLSLNVLDKLPASIMFVIFIALALGLAFSITPSMVASAYRRMTGKNVDGDTDLEGLKTKADPGFKINEGVSIEHSSEKGRISLKNTAEKLSTNENHEALTTASDPDWKFPGVNLLDQKQDKADAGDVNANAQAIRDTFSNFNIEVEMEGANVGPRVTQYTLKPPTGVKLTKITALDNNLALDLAAQSIRIEAPIPGKRAVGIEVPNVKAAMVRLSSILQSGEWTEQTSGLAFAIGKDIGGKSVVTDLAKMPHLLVAGQTGSGKSVMINTILTSLLYRNSPADLKLILVDPKQVELKPYDDIPHLLTPVITEPEKCISALKWAVAEMERRYKALSEVGKRNIAEYNLIKKEEGMPYIIIVIDELADLMMMAARDVEALIVRIAQKARAVGIHLVLATQRPSVDVITGLIKANVPARIAFTTASQIDSRTIIDQMGAEKLLGMGDMLLLTAEMPKPRRIQGAFISDAETSKVTDFIRMQRPPQYDAEVISQPVQIGKGGVVASNDFDDTDDDMWKDAIRVVIEGRKASTSLLQRRLRIGYGRAARLIETMEEQGIVGPADGARPRDVLVNSLDDVFGGDGGAAESAEAE